MAGAVRQRGRVHVVLVPGFAGFDALGQLEYYAGLTPIFRAWTARNPRAHVVLHYFDNFPTAAVTTRAARLHGYLAKRIARGEIVPGDEVCLVGHSTGGLDIRRLVWDLAHDPEARLVDGGVPVTAADVLGFVRRAVFLSVPHWGTNIADWVGAHGFGRMVVLLDLRAGVAGSQFPVLDRIEGWITGAAASISGVDLMRAIQDALCEAEVDGIADPTRSAEARDAAAHLELWLRHMTADFSAIDDLASDRKAAGPASPAHFPPEIREEELSLWSEKRIKTRSYATLGRRLYRYKPSVPAALWDPMKPWTYAESLDDGAQTDLVYRTCYRMCAGGPFEYDAGNLGFEFWDNDGIVNTGSMFWPNTKDAVLVTGDHMDIVGHYKLTPVQNGGGRKYQSYDLLGSASGFGDGAFERVWTGIFDFCACER